MGFPCYVHYVTAVVCIYTYVHIRDVTNITITYYDLYIYFYFVMHYRLLGKVPHVTARKLKIDSNVVMYVVL
jgi:hypothetical protein